MSTSFDAPDIASLVPDPDEVTMILRDLSTFAEKPAHACSLAEIRRF